MRKLYSSWATTVIAVLVLLAGVSSVRSQQLRMYPTLSLRNFHCMPDGIERVPGPGAGGDRYFLVPVWIYNEADTNYNPNNDGQHFGQHLEPIRSFEFQFWYLTQAMVLDTGHGSPIVLTGPQAKDTALAKTFFVQWSDQQANDPTNPYRHVIRIAGASSVPLPLNNSADSGCSEHNGVLLWLRFKVVVSAVNAGEIHLDSARFNDHVGDSLINAPGGPSLDYTHGNFGGGIGTFGASKKGYGLVQITAQPAFLLKPLSQIGQIDDANDSLLVDLVYDPTVSGGTVTRSIQVSDAVGNTEIDNVLISSDQQWLTVNENAPGGTDTLFLPNDAIDYTTSFGSQVRNIFMTVGNPQNLAPGVYYATVTFQSYGASNSPLKLHVRFVRLAAPNEPTASGTGIRLNISNSCSPVCTNVLTFGTGAGATEGIDVLYGESKVMTSDITNFDTLGRCYAYFKPLNPSADVQFQDPNFVGLTRDIRSPNTDTTLIYQVNFNPGNVNCYPVKVCVDPSDFPAGGRIVLKFTLNGGEQGIDLRQATLDQNNMRCVTINDHRIDHFYIYYTPATIANIATFLKPFSWTLISLPVVVPNPDASIIFPNAVTPPFAYGSQSGWFQPAANLLEFGRGYMIRYGDFIGNDGIVAGTLSYQVSNVKIQQGWNTVGATSGVSTVTDINFTPNQGSTQVPSLLTNDYVWEFTPQHGYDQTGFLTPGKGYFIKVDYSGYYNLTGHKEIAKGGSSNWAGKSNDRSNVIGQLTNVYVRDAEQNGQNLYFGHVTTSIPEGQFEMPNQFQSFDARFATNSGMASYNHSSYVVNLHASNFPVTMNFTNLSGSVEVTDMNGKVIGTATNNGIVTISDPTTTQVRIAEKQEGVGSNMVGFSLEQNQPNPFNATSKITYTLPQESVVSLVVYNALGEVVSTLVNGVVSAGPHEAIFDGSNLPAGTYYYTLKAGNFVQTQHMTLSH